MEPKIAILTIGTEITSGLEADTNSHCISKELFNHGFLVKRHLSVSDSIEEIIPALKQLTADFQVVIITGGIGPTEDDLTREAVAQAFDLALENDEELVSLLKERHKPAHALKMASFPEGASMIKPSKGLVGGFYLSVDRSFLISLPGVPSEVQVLLHENVLPVLDKNFKPQITRRRRLFKIANMPEVQVEEKLSEGLAGLKGDYSYGLLPKLGAVHLYITVCGETAEQADQNLADIEKQVGAIFGADLFAKDDQTLEEDVISLLRDRKLTLGLAESSTGGLIASRITSIAGSSDVFLGGFVTYSNELKYSLGVDPLILEEKGAVSAEVASEMAQATLKKAGCDIAASVTGIAGPTGQTKDKALGLHYIGLVRKGGKPLVKKFTFRGSRQQVQWQAGQQALFTIREQILDDLIIG